MDSFMNYWSKINVFFHHSSNLKSKLKIIILSVKTRFITYMLKDENRLYTRISYIYW